MRSSRALGGCGRIAAFVVCIAHVPHETAKRGDEGELRVLRMTTIQAREDAYGVDQKKKKKKLEVISARVVVGREVGSLPTLRLLYEPEGLDSEGGILRQNSRHIRING